MISRTIYIIDTGYLLEFFKVDKHFSEAAHNEVTERFKSAQKANAEFFVPLPCIYELGNHIAHIRNGDRRRELAQFLLKTLESCVKYQMPWSITPATGIDKLIPLCHDFANEYINFTKENAMDSGSIGFVDAAVLYEAQRLHEQYKNEKRNPCVHIWTTDSALKAHEPDKELDPFVHE